MQLCDNTLVCLCLVILCSESICGVLLMIMCVQVPGQPAGPSEPAPPVGQLQPERRPHGSRPLQRGDRHRGAHPPRHHIHHPFCVHLLFHTWVQLPLGLSLSSVLSPAQEIFFFLSFILCSHASRHLIFEMCEWSSLLRLCVRTCLCAKVVTVWCRDNPPAGTLHTAVRMHPPHPQHLASANTASWNKHSQKLISWVTFGTLLNTLI